MDLDSSDCQFATLLVFENSTKNKDIFSDLDIVSKKYLLNASEMQFLLETSFQSQSENF
jgi:hypothetical protein